MTQSSPRFSPLGHWQHLRLVLVLALPLASLACKSRSSFSFHAQMAALGRCKRQMPPLGRCKHQMQAQVT